MTRKLSALPTATLSKIRHLRVREENVYLDFDIQTYIADVAHLLKLLPGLQLDTLAVLASPDCEPSVHYRALNALIHYSDGWKELRFIYRCSTLFGYSHDYDIYASASYNEQSQRKPQPTHWMSVMRHRDGIDSHPSVTIYRSTIPDTVGSVMDVKTRVLFEQQQPLEETEAENFAAEEYAPIMSDGEKEKELMVVVKRGKGVDYREKQESPYLPDYDLRQASDGMTRMVIKEALYGVDEVPLDERRFLRGGGIKAVDTYLHVDDYDWMLPKSLLRRNIYICK